MNNADKNERKRIIVQRRLRQIGETYDLPRLSRSRLHKLTDMCLKTLGEDGIVDADLRVLHKLTTRGLLD